MQSVGRRARRVAFLVLLAASAASADVSPSVLAAGGVSVDRETIERRLAELPAFQRDTLGPTPSAIRDTFVERVLIPELLYAAEARRLSVEDSVRARDREREILRRALLRDLEEKELTERPITENELRRYYDQSRAEFSSPEKIRVWRIVVGSRERALEVLSNARKPDGLERWRAAAREYSLDQATKLRGGDVGFVASDGATDVPRVRIAPEVFRAVQALTDGELASEPLEHGGRFHVLWRRGTRPAAERAFEDERERIRALLGAERVEKAMNALLAKLRKTHLRERNDAPLERIAVPGFDVAVPGTPKPPQRAAERPPAPQNTDLGAR
jgi:peptidyl-prolyl cis-trans isomerase C